MTSQHRASHALTAPLLVLCSTVLLAGCGTTTGSTGVGASASAAAAGAVKSGAPSSPQADLSSTAEKIKALGESSGIDQYAGLALDQAAGVVRVWRVPGNADLDRALEAAAAPGVTVQFEDALHSGHELDQVRDRLMARFGSQVVGANVPPDGSAVEVIVTSDHLGLATRIEQVGPAGTVNVRAGTGGAA